MRILKVEPSWEQDGLDMQARFWYFFKIAFNLKMSYEQFTKNERCNRIFQSWIESLTDDLIIKIGKSRVK